MTGRLFILMGIPGAGKSSFVSTHIKSGFTQAWISRDMIRFDIVKENESYFSKEDEVFKKFIEHINHHLADGYDVFADATHLNKKSRAKLLKNLTVKPQEVSVIWLQTPLNECIKRNEKRAGTRSYVPPTQICRMAKSLQMPTFDEDINKVYIIKPNEEIQIIDLKED